MKTYPSDPQTTLDWSKPIQFRDGEPCELMETKSANFPGKPIAVLRPNEPNAMCAIWFYPESGKGSKPEKDIVNKEDDDQEDEHNEIMNGIINFDGIAP